MARLTLEDLRADPLVKPDFEIMKGIGLSENEPWGFVCRMLDFCDDEYFNLKAKSMFSVYIAGYFSCYHNIKLETIKEVFK